MLGAQQRSNTAKVVDELVECGGDDGSRLDIRGTALSDDAGCIAEVRLRAGGGGAQACIPPRNVNTVGSTRFKSASISPSM